MDDNGNINKMLWELEREISKLYKTIMCKKCQSF